MKTSARILIGFSVAVFVSACAFVAFVMYSLYGPEIRVQQSLHVYSGAKFMGEDRARWGANAAQKSLYYWSQDSLEDVRGYYETFIDAFVAAGDEYGQWLITAYRLDGSPIKAFVPSAFLSHGSFCTYRETCACVSVALVDSSQKDLWQLPVVSPSNFQHLTPPPSLSSVPSRGTLIIYSYYVEDE